MLFLIISRMIDILHTKQVSYQFLLAILITIYYPSKSIQTCQTSQTLPIPQGFPLFHGKYLSVQGQSRSSSGSSEIYADFDAIGDGDGGDLLHLSGGALEVDVSLVDGHLPVVPGLGALTAGGSPAADAEVLVGDADGAGDLDALGLGVSDQLVGDLLDGVELAAAEGDSRSLELGVLYALLFGVLVSHVVNNINIK